MNPSRLREPGLYRPPGHERYRVRGGGALALTLRAGDRITVTDPEGRQTAELYAFADGATNAGADPGLLGLQAGPVSATLARVVADDSESARALTASLRRRGVDQAASATAAAAAPSARLLDDDDDAAGRSASLTAVADALCVVCAPGGPMAVDRHDPPTELRLDVVRERRGAGADETPSTPLPEPLAEPRLDLRIDRRSARAYPVRAGEYIQIIDVDGRECTDFQAFTQRGLQRGEARCLDATVTRSLMGAACPAPGLYSKFYDVDMRPLVEVVRDTVGRHDTFSLACTAKYYDDIGYPGHVNCTDNFNQVLAPHGVAARAGWEAINFFYNTNLDDQHQIYLDEPWSRPGDYVLLRALTDLICVSSACPDDTSAANGWQPTDIHVRVYPAEHVFSKAVAYRMTPDSDAELTKETAFHPRTGAHTRRFTEYRGYWLPSSFTRYGALEEYWACRERAALMDLSPLRKFEVFGPDAEALLQYAMTRNIRKLGDGQVVYTAICYDTGGMLDDGTVFRLGDNNFRWIGGDDYSGLWLRQLAERLGLRVWVKSSTDQLHNVALQGPQSRAILNDLIWTSPAQPTVDELGWFRFAIARLGDEHGAPLIVSRTGYTGELGFELWCHPKDALTVWDAVWEAGRPHDLAPLGLDALDTLRIEAGLIFAGYEFCDQTDPFEAGIPFAVPLKTKTDDFVGKDALIRRKTQPQRRLVGLELAGDETAAHGDCVRVGRLQVGTITSATRSPILGKNIALCKMAIEYAAADTEVEVGKLDGQQKRLPARVVPLPFYDPEKRRVRA